MYPSPIAPNGNMSGLLVHTSSLSYGAIWASEKVFRPLYPPCKDHEHQLAGLLLGWCGLWCHVMEMMTIKQPPAEELMWLSASLVDSPRQRRRASVKTGMAPQSGLSVPSDSAKALLRLSVWLSASHSTRSHVHLAMVTVRWGSKGAFSKKLRTVLQDREWLFESRASLGAGSHTPPHSRFGSLQLTSNHVPTRKQQ